MRSLRGTVGSGYDVATGYSRTVSASLTVEIGGSSGILQATGWPRGEREMVENISETTLRDPDSQKQGEARLHVTHGPDRRTTDI